MNEGHDRRGDDILLHQEPGGSYLQHGERVSVLGLCRLIVALAERVAVQRPTAPARCRQLREQIFNFSIEGLQRAACKPIAATLEVSRQSFPKTPNSQRWTAFKRCPHARSWCHTLLASICTAPSVAWVMSVTSRSSDQLRNWSGFA